MKKIRWKFFENVPFYFCFGTWMILCGLTGAARIELYKGHPSFRQYLHDKLCNNKPFVLVENYRFDNEIAAVPNVSIQPQIDRVLRQSPNCKYGHLNNVDIDRLSQLLPTMELFVYYRTKQFIFDLSNFQIANLSIFAQVLQALAKFYEHCSSCTPFLVLFDHSLGPQKLFEWSKFAFALMPLTFKLALIADLDSTMVTVLWRPVLDGCRSNEPIFWPRSVTDFARLNVHFRDCNLGSITLNVSVNQYIPLCRYTHDRATNQLIGQYSVEMEFLKILAARYNFRYRLIDAKQVWGMRDPVHGKWNGLIGHVVDGISNMAMCGVTRTIARYSVIDFTRYMLSSGVTFITHSPKRLEVAQLIAPTLFTATWYGLVAVFFLLTVMLYATLRQSHSYGCVLQMFFAITMRQSENSLISTLRTDSSRLLCASWLIATVIVCNFYGSIFFSLLALSKYGSAIDTIDDLVREANADRYQIMVSRDSAYHQRFVQSGPENSVWYSIGRHLNRTMPNGFIEPGTNVIQLVEQNPKIIAMSPRFFLENLRNTMATIPLTIGSDDVWKTASGMVLPKRSPLLYPFNNVILKVREQGIFIYWLKRAGSFDAYKHKNNRANLEAAKAISVQDIAWLFKMFQYAYPICATVLLIEIGSKWWSHKILPKLAFHFEKFIPVQTRL